MPEAQCIKYPIKPGRRERLLTWIRRLEYRSAELAEAMSEGGVLAEAVFLDTSDTGEHRLIYTSAEDLEAGMEALSRSTDSLVQEFNQVLAECVDLDDAVALDLVFHTPLDGQGIPFRNHPGARNT